ncbi:hypothetical protein [Microbacterium sp.]
MARTDSKRTATARAHTLTIRTARAAKRGALTITRAGHSRHGK